MLCDFINKIILFTKNNTNKLLILPLKHTIPKQLQHSHSCGLIININIIYKPQINLLLCQILPSLFNGGYINKNINYNPSPDRFNLNKPIQHFQ